MAVEGYTPAVGQIGSQLMSTFSMFDGAILNPDAALVLEYERMLDSDETVSASYYFLTLCVISFLGEYTHSDPKIQQFVHDCLEAMDGSLTLACEDILSAIWAGYSATEICWKAVSGRLMLDYLATYHPYTITFYLNDRGRMRTVNQRRMFSAMGEDIPPEKCLLYTFRKRFNNYYGKSAFRPIRKNWLLKDPELKMWARALDRFGTPIVAGTVPEGTVKDPATGEEITQLEYTTNLLAKLQSGTAIVLEAREKSGNTQIPKVEVLAATQTGVGGAFDKSLSYLNKMISRGLLVPSLVFDEGARTGSLALGTSHFNGFLLMAGAIYKQLKEVFLDQFISRLLTYNFGPQKDWGDFQERALSPDELKLYSEVFMNLTSSGFVDPSVDDDFQYARQTMGLPTRDIAASTVQGKTAAAYERYLRAGAAGQGGA